MKLIKYLILALAALASCANPQPPSGGPPDTTPPEIIEYSPSHATRNFSGESAQFRFSEWVNKNSVIENLHVQPEIKTEYDWSGAELEIEFAEALAENTTYLIMIGGGYKDLRGNNPEEAFAITFSTGDKLDSGKISGTVYGEDKSGAYVFAYRIDGIDADTLNTIHTPPDYFMQCGSSGKFRLLALRDGLYRIIAITDKFENRLFDPGQDKFGAAPNDILVMNGRSDDCEIKLGSALDMRGPLLFEATGISRRSVELMFSEAVAPASIRRKSFSAEDSLGRAATIAGAMPHPQEENKALVYFEKELTAEMNYSIRAVSSGEFAIRDSSGNPLQDTAAAAEFVAAGDPDTTGLKIFKTSIADSAQGIDPADSISIYFTKPIEMAEDTIVALYNSSASFSQPARNRRISGNILRIDPAGDMKYNSWHRLSLNTRAVADIYGNPMKDSVFVLDFMTLDNRSFGGASGVLRDSALGCANLVLVAVDGSGQRYKANMDSTGKWQIGNLPEGAYHFEVFCDKNKNGRYDYGRPYPFVHGEKFRKIDREISIKARWDVEEILLILK
jgi:hypothetical protein